MLLLSKNLCEFLVKRLRSLFEGARGLEQGQSYLTLVQFVDISTIPGELQIRMPEL